MNQFLERILQNWKTTAVALTIGVLGVISSFVQLPAGLESHVIEIVTALGVTLGLAAKD